MGFWYRLKNFFGVSSDLPTLEAKLPAPTRPAPPMPRVAPARVASPAPPGETYQGTERRRTPRQVYERAREEEELRRRRQADIERQRASMDVSDPWPVYPRPTAPVEAPATEPCRVSALSVDSFSSASSGSCSYSSSASSDSCSSSDSSSGSD